MSTCCSLCLPSPDCDPLGMCPDAPPQRLAGGAPAPSPRHPPTGCGASCPALRAARAEAERLRGEAARAWHDSCQDDPRQCEECASKLDVASLRAEVERLTQERDSASESGVRHLVRCGALEAEVERLRALTASVAGPGGPGAGGR